MTSQLFSLLTIFSLTLCRISSTDVCLPALCKCSDNTKIVNCDSKRWKNLQNIDFPVNVMTLTLVNNQLKFDTGDDREKIENLISLTDLSLNQNPLGVIPPFYHRKISSLSLQDVSLTSAEFPPSYSGSNLHRISLNRNKIRLINENDFTILSSSPVERLSLDAVELSTIDPNAFVPLNFLQSLSLKNNRLRSCPSLSTMPRLQSIKLDGNQLTSLPEELTIPRNIQVYSFTNNLISVIDEVSPLYRWWKNNLTNVQVYLANNSFDCCRSLWFIELLKSNPPFVADSQLLVCASPSELAGKQMITLNPSELNCGGSDPGKSWWTPERIIGVITGCIVILAMVIVGILLTVRKIRARISHSGYERIGDIDDSLPNVPDNDQRPFPPSDDEEDRDSIFTSVSRMRSPPHSEAPTLNTNIGTHAIDPSIVDGLEAISQAVAMPDSL